MNELKVFTLEEANQLLPALTKLIHKLKKKREVVMAIEVQIDATELISNGEDSSSADLDHLAAEHHQVVGEFYSIVDQIHKHGCFLKDAEVGLIDFYGIIEDRVVYLCWRLGESKISYWHETSQGYSHRQPLNS